MSLEQQLDGLTAELAAGGKIPPPLLARLMADIRAQIASGASRRALKAGDTAPVFRLKNQDGTWVRSNILIARGPLVISFYRGRWCSYCNLELQALEKARAEIESRKASLVVISMQNEAYSRKAVTDNKLGFASLIDHDGAVAERFGLRYNLSDQLIELHKSLGLELGLINGEAGWSLLMPARYVIGRDGIVAYAEINTDYTHRAEPRDLLPILDQLARSDFAPGRFRPSQP